MEEEKEEVGRVCVLSVLTLHFFSFALFSFSVVFSVC